MRCPPEITEIVTEILRTALLRIRASQSADFCVIEADHVHNLPDVLNEFLREKLEHYWTVERPAYVARACEDGRRAFEEFWTRLAPHVNAEQIAEAVS